MNIGLYPKIAYEGMRKNGKLYIPYCITCILMVAIYYIVHFLAFSGVLIGIPGASTAVQMLGFGVYVITIFSAIFLFYTQSTLIKGRKKEFGLYSVLGMNKNNLGMIIFYETIMTWIAAIFGGLILGIGMSKVAELGFTRMIAAQDKVRQLTGKEPSKALNPDECVAIGACIQGGKIAGDAGAGDILLLDVTPLSLSIETMGGVATRLIERNTTIPTKKSQIFSTAADNQTAVDIHVVQGERQFAKDNKTLGMFRLDGIAPARRGVPQIEVTFDIDANGIVNVSAKDLGTGKEQHITITSGSNMSDADIEKAVKEAAEYEAQDKARKEAVDVRNDADAMAFQVEKALQEAGDKLPETEKASVEADLAELKAALEATPVDGASLDQVENLKAKKETLMNNAQNLFAKLYEQNQGAAGAADAGSAAGGADDVVDGDYREV